MANYGQQLRKIVDDYIASDDGPWPATARQIAAWAIKTKRWRPHESKVIGQCADDLARAMRDEYFTDKQGRSVRAKHAARITRDGEQMVLWADIRTAPHEHIELAIKQRRQQIVGDCYQLKQDADSYNENRSPIRPIQVSFDFTNDLAELEATR